MTSIINRKGTKTEPCGTALFIPYLIEIVSTQLYCVPYCLHSVKQMHKIWTSSEQKLLNPDRVVYLVQILIIITIMSTGWAGVSCLKNPAKVWSPPSSAPHPLISQCWTWVITTCWIQVWRNLLMAWRVFTVNWRFSSKCTLHLLNIRIHDMYILYMNRIGGLCIV